MKITSRYLVLFLVLVTYPTLNAAEPRQPRIIDKHGSQIPSIYYGALPDPRVVYELTGRSASSTCSLLKAVYRESENRARIVQVQDSCGSHYMVDYYRNCGSECGGTEDWTFADSTISEWCIGYTFNYTSCNTQNCRDQYTCYQCF